LLELQLLLHVDLCQLLQTEVSWQQSCQARPATTASAAAVMCHRHHHHQQQQQKRQQQGWVQTPAAALPAASLAQPSAGPRAANGCSHHALAASGCLWVQHKAVVSTCNTCFGTILAGFCIGVV
jgi:hypothetical protein